MQLHRTQRSLARLALCTLAVALSSCVIVRFEGDFPDDSWMSDVVHGSAMPAGFEHGSVEASFVGTVATRKCELEMNFACAPDELDAYLDGVCDSVERELRERDGAITSRAKSGPRSVAIEYERDDERGEAEIRVEDTPGAGALPYVLEIRWREH